ncbi:hypothetical protein ZOSMA_330G00210 [Zostera marina]|uniref:Uncharacterized protein n=1 Tax=Zostera marina TaxID=29655 RepID=A0A0K9PAK5_ZOSMR|nr:hypothetical protein ZOSMA_330G00210 [Zostera marina]
MTSVVVKNVVVMAPDAFLDQCHSTSATSYGWFGSPRISFSIDLPSSSDDKPPTSSESATPPPSKLISSSSSVSLLDFEFCPEDSVSMFPADELISEGKLVPLHLRSNHQEVVLENVSESLDPHEDEDEEGMVTFVEENGVTSVSPKAPKCSSRWKEFLGLKKAAVLNNNKQVQIRNLTKSGTGSGSRSLKHFLHRNSKPTNPNLNDSLSSLVPLLRCDSDSNVDHTPAPLASALPSRRSVDREKSQKPAQIPCPKNQPTKLRVPSKPSRKIPDPTRPLPDYPVVRSGRSQMRHATDSTISPRGVSVDSPRMNSSGKIVFQNLGRSSSSPSTYGAGPRTKSRAMERSYSSSVRITPVLNVPVCSLRGSSKSVFGLFSQQKKDSKKDLPSSSSSSSSSSGNNRSVCKIEKQ